MTWFRYERVCGHHVPVVSVKLRHERGTWSQPIKFLIDSGASVSFVPSRMVRSIVADLHQRSEQATSLVDASGNPMKGVPMDFDLDMLGKPGRFRVRERIWVSRAGTWGMLGQTWFENMGVNFQNFPDADRGRRFALYKPPGPGSPGDVTTCYVPRVRSGRAILWQ